MRSRAGYMYVYNKFAVNRVLFKLRVMIVVFTLPRRD